VQAWIEAGLWPDMTLAEITVTGLEVFSRGC